MYVTSYALTKNEYFEFRHNLIMQVIYNLDDLNEVIIIDNDYVSVALTRISIKKILGNTIRVVNFVNYSDALNYLLKQKNGEPPIIFIDPFSDKGNNYSFLERYMLLNLSCYVYILSNSILMRDIGKCLAYKFVKKYITKPIKIDDLIFIFREIKSNGKGVGYNSLV